MSDDREDVYSKAVRAGKRTYFFDVKSTRGRDLYLTITESKKHTHEDGTAHYDKHKIFLYKEDFEKFLDGLQDAYGEIDRLKSTGEYGNGPEPNSRQSYDPGQGSDAPPFTDVNFEDLDRKDI
ncbi:MAG: PUR family DNA/RNA-binding protein [Flavobacteriales bacterium]|nr:PUR family DNA/RNA-binding protein [Flavobacteriales bacterium]